MRYWVDPPAARIGDLTAAGAVPADVSVAVSVAVSGWEGARTLVIPAGEGFTLTGAARSTDPARTGELHTGSTALGLVRTPSRNCCWSGCPMVGMRMLDRKSTRL